MTAIFSAFWYLMMGALSADCIENTLSRPTCQANALAWLVPSSDGTMNVRCCIIRNDVLCSVGPRLDRISGDFLIHFYSMSIQVC